MTDLSDILSEDLLKNLAGERFFERGVEYFQEERVCSLAQDGDEIFAEVEGNQIYQVRLWLLDDELHSDCTCPMGEDGYFCKHCVAVGLAWIDEPPLYHPPTTLPSQGKTTIADLRNYLARQERDTLIQLILDRVTEDEHWRKQLLMKTASHRPEGVDIGTCRRTLRKTIPIRDFVDYYEAASYAEDVQSVIDALEELVEVGYASDVVDLSEEAMSLLDDALESVDDSDGNLNEILDQVQELHYRACEIARPNSQALAERLFRAELESGFGFFHNALERYSEILGEQGRKTYEQLVDTEWEQLPKVAPGESTGFNYRRSILAQMKETLVAASGSLEELVAVISKDLSHPSRYLKIARLYYEAEQLDEAETWAKRGLEAFKPSFGTSQLGDFLVTLYEQQGRLDAALDIVWEKFVNYPSLHTYQQLQEQAVKADAWSPWRDRALDCARDQTDIGRSLLVEIFLWEGDPKQAWQEAKAGGCSQQLWMRLAPIRAKEHPEDALSVYLPQIEPLVEQTEGDRTLSEGERVDASARARGTIQPTCHPVENQVQA